ncbi:hypothetical protein SeMB42_g01198 [Synchytrium endobioticum]|uniref:Uncharacterized protein n=1 Tax=Synchytrium endobioticum TaxID=286115 RepID=A0A507DPC4_9FUNG|nr:hypothetical protein SeLEV6574_g05763 [Synchytrium endobioticum]TPX52728.1 hypothetical protein SeMB42_g01198 [Synchytrium endobioticum]
MARKQTPGKERKEPKTVKEARAANTAKANEIAFKYVLPGLGIFSLVFFMIFFWVFGFGENNKTGTKAYQPPPFAG